MKLQFYLRFHTKVGESLWISGNAAELGTNEPDLAVAMEFLNDEYWQATVEIKRKDLPETITYKYYLKNEDGELIGEWGDDRSLDGFKNNLHEVQLIDTWNHAGEYENVFFSLPFKDVLLKRPAPKGKGRQDKSFTHIFKIKAPLLNKNEIVCIFGSGNKLGEWKTSRPQPMARQGNWWVSKLDLEEESLPIAYKYGIYNVKEDRFIHFENGNNRLLFSDAGKKKLTIIHDGFIQLPNNTWKGAGVAIPVFSLRSRNGFGVGEFADIKLLVDWTQQVGLKLIQLLPVNDTIANNNWLDSYPYAAISAFALHPLYINLPKVAGKKYGEKIVSLRRKQKQLNELPAVDYVEVMKYKLSVLRELYELMGEEDLASAEYLQFFDRNQHWLLPYAAFCYFRDKYGSSHFEEWRSNGNYDKAEIEKIFNSPSVAARDMKLYCFIQYHLHLQLKEAADYAHKKGIILKGDIPIGIYRYGCDAWTEPRFYNMNWQAGAPPDDFTAVGQNWGFPTYNWKRMQEDGFSWWKQRFAQMNDYFDAFRIDHILGFFRIWSIPTDAVQGIMGRFVPCLPVHINEFGENGIWFDHDRFCKPFISDEILNAVFGEELAGSVKSDFLVPNDRGGYDLQDEYASQLLIEKHFEQNPSVDGTEKLKLGLYDLVSNVIFFEEEGSQGQHLHFRISMESTSTFQNLIPHIQDKLRELYVNYFYRRQDDFWKKEAMNKLPYLKAATNMLVCGEDLGMVPHCVPDVMEQLGILSLEIQRMPKDPAKEFFHPNDAPYLSVITPSTHDMSTIRGWWEENRERTQHFYNNILGQLGDAPYYCESWINRAIVLQHLYSPAMWSIFQMQDILGMSDTLRREKPQDERINNPANPKNFWQYRMHVNLEDFLREKDFNEELAGYVHNSGRS
jgi:4-alpha-glucanotransferase